jgi:hypothetical protein
MLRTLACLACLVGCQPVPVPVRAQTSPFTIRRETSFVPAPTVGGSRLATDRAVKMVDADADAMTALGAAKLGVLHVRVVDRVDPATGEWTEKVVWPGASIDAAALGATHARTLTLAEPPPSRFDCGRRRRSPCDGPMTTKIVTATYELWHVPPERWAELPEGLRPNALPASAIRDVQPGNWVRPPPVVTVRSE